MLNIFTHKNSHKLLIWGDRLGNWLDCVTGFILLCMHVSNGLVVYFKYTQFQF